MRRPRWWEWVALGAFIAVCGAILFPILASARVARDQRRRPAIKATCLGNLKQAAMAMQIYQGDFDDRCPPRDAWIDATDAYTKNLVVYHCPSEKGSWGFAFNSALDQKSVARLETPADTPVLYDSINPAKNASDPFKSLPPVPRHGRNNVSYADGHTVAVAP